MLKHDQRADEIEPSIGDVIETRHEFGIRDAEDLRVAFRLVDHLRRDVASGDVLHAARERKREPPDAASEIECGRRSGVNRAK
jgi:hypothetical protein